MFLPIYQPAKWDNILLILVAHQQYTLLLILSSVSNQTCYVYENIKNNKLIEFFTQWFIMSPYVINVQGEYKSHFFGGTPCISTSYQLILGSSRYPCYGIGYYFSV